MIRVHECWDPFDLYLRWHGSGLECAGVREVMPLEFCLHRCPVCAWGIGADVVSPVDDEHAARQLSCAVGGLRRVQRNVVWRAEAGGDGNGGGNVKV